MLKKYNPEVHHRRSLRLQGYDYTRAGAYFITICIQHRECLFGEMINDQMHLNQPGRMILSIWDELPQHYAGVDIDAFVIMPNHIHGIIVLIDSNARPQEVLQPTKKGQPQRVAPTMSLSDVVHRFKSLATTRYRQGVISKDWQPFPGKLWQRNYYERVIRSEKELHQIREYIAANPIRWAEDENNPALILNGKR